MGKMKEFISVNGIKQKELATFLGIGEPSVSKMVKGFSNPSEGNLRKLLSNDRGWDTSMLVENGNTITQKGRTNKVFSGACNTVYESGLEEMLDEKDQQIAELKAQLAEEKARSERYLTMIEKLMDK